MNLQDYDIVFVEYLKDYDLKITFKNGKIGVLSIDKYFSSGNTFLRLKNKDVFKSYEVKDGVLTWCNGDIDIAPETVYHDATKEPYPQWLCP